MAISMVAKKERSTRSILSSEAKAKLAQMVDDAYSHGTHYVIQRFDTPRAVLIPLKDYQRLLAAEAAGVQTIKESGASYNLGTERTPKEVAALLGATLNEEE